MTSQAHNSLNEGESDYWINDSVTDRTFDDDFDLGNELLVQHGNFGKLFECKPKGTELSMCLKLVPKNKERRVFNREASHLLKLNHPNLVRLREIFENQDNIYLVSDFHPGSEVLARVSKRSVFTERDAARILRQILEGLRYIHDEELVHGNLKPSNFIFEGREDDSSVKIADVASYPILGRELIHHSVTSVPEYCAPEVIKREQCDYSSDMWSFGAFAYTLLCGEKPFSSEDIEALYKQIFKANYQTGSPNFDSLSLNAKDFLIKFFSLDPKKRTSAFDALKNNWIRGRATKNENLEHCLASMSSLVNSEAEFKSHSFEDQEDPQLALEDDQQPPSNEFSSEY